MEIKNFNLIKEKAGLILGKIRSLSDRDKSKTGISPDSDWEHVLIFAVVMVLIFALVSGYLWFSVEQQDIDAGNLKAGETALSKDKIIKAMAIITKEEETYNSLVAQPPKLADPSR